MITYNGTDLETAYTCKIFRTDTDRAPGRVYDVVDIPGRSGSLLLDGKRYPNVEMEYTALFYGTGADANAKAMRSFLLSQIGYKRMLDSEHSDEFYLAYIPSDIEPIITADRGMVKMALVFSRKPQRYLVSGETKQTFTSTPGAITNPTQFEAQPLLRIYGTGKVWINSDIITISAADSYTDIDCEMMDAYKGTASKNNNITLSGHNFPVLKAGTNSVAKESTITKVEITPRWWTL